MGAWRRCIGRIGVVASLLFCVATVTLWARSYWWCDVARRAATRDAQGTQTRMQIHSVRGVLSVAHVRRERRGPIFGLELMGGGLQSVKIGKDTLPYSGFLPDEHVMGFGVVHKVDVDPTTGEWEQRWIRTGVSAPHWFAAMLFAIAPMRWVVRHVRARRRAGGCPVCGYDLRATPQRCPECGAEA